MKFYIWSILPSKKRKKNGTKLAINKNCSRPNSWNSKSYISETYNSLPVGRQRSSCTADNQVVLQPDAEEGTTALHREWTTSTRQQ